jgi:lipoprotein-anchoring transpeptidase ErfK/SrfK
MITKTSIAKFSIQLAAILLATTVSAAAQQAPAATQTPAPVPVPLPAKRTIVVSLEDRRLALIEDGAVKQVYTVAVGKPSTPSPVGTFTIESHVMNPTYSHNGKVVAPGPGNPVGSRWMGLSIRGYGIHGTNVPSSIGKAASHGCIRMAKADLEQLFPLVHAGDTVEIVGQRNQETAQLFGAPQPQADPQKAAPAATQTAQAAPAAAPAQAAQTPAIPAAQLAQEVASTIPVR